MKKTIEELEKKLILVKNLKDTKDFFNLECEISKILETLSENNLKQLKIESNLYVNFIKEVLLNSSFNKNFLIIMQQEKILKKSSSFKILKKEECDKKILESNIKEKQIIREAFCLGGLILANVIKYLSPENVSYLRRNINWSLKQILEYQKRRFSFQEICFKLHEIIHNDFLYNPKEPFPQFRLDTKFLFKHLTASSSLIGSMLLILPITHTLSSAFKRAINKIGEMKDFSIIIELNKINGIIFKINKGIDHFKNFYKTQFNDEIDFINFIDNFSINNEMNILYIINVITCDVYGEEWHESILKKIEEAKNLKKDINYFARNKFRAFYDKIRKEQDVEWSIKIYIISQKTLSLLEDINEAKDNMWKVNTALYEMYHWMNEVHRVLNKYDIEDDWGKIVDFIQQENENVEWKSTFFTPIQEEFISNEIDSQKGKLILNDITKAILGMINANGGVIIIGLVENPHEIIRSNIKENLFIKNSITFFDIKYELNQKNKKIDDIKRQIQDFLANVTLLSVDKFNNLWDIESIEIKDDYKTIEIYKINVKASDSYIYSIEKRNDIYWLSLIKRANGRTIHVDPREHLIKTG